MKKLPLKSSILGFLFLLVLTGCGVKGNPVPFPAIPDKIPLVENMQALSMEESVLLKWNFRDKSRLISHIKIERSDAGQTGNECRDCPQTFVGIGRVDVKEEPADKEKRELSFTDIQAVKGNTYKYRLMLCEENENCSEAAAAEINFK